MIGKSLLGKLTQIVDSGMVVKDKAGSIFSLKTLIDAKKYMDVMNNKTLSGYYKLVQSEFEKIKKDFEKNKKIVDNLILYELKSTLKLKSNFASYIERSFGDKVIAIYQRDENCFSFSLRKGKKMTIDLDNLAKEATRSIENADGGGHPDAAGMRVPIKELKPLVENLKLRMKSEPVKR